MAATSIPEADLKRNLQSLACAKYKILKKHPPSREVSDDDAFTFNSGFSSNLQRIKISTVASKVENQEESKETVEKVEEERRHQTDVS
jgi:cullin 3